jgi:hypothetical protein
METLYKKPKSFKIHIYNSTTNLKFPTQAKIGIIFQKILI